MADEDLEKRVVALEAKFGIAVAVAIVLGLGGAGIGGLLANAYSQIEDLGTKSKALRADLEGLQTKLEGSEGKIIKDITDIGAKKIIEIKEVVAGAIGRIKIEQHSFCTTDRDDEPNCRGYQRFDLEETPLDAVAKNLCKGLKYNTPRQTAGGSGGKHGWAHYDVTCFSFE